MLTKQSCYGTKSAGDIGKAIKIKNQSNSVLYFLATFIIFTSLLTDEEGQASSFSFSSWLCSLGCHAAGTALQRQDFPHFRGMLNWGYFLNIKLFLFTVHSASKNKTSIRVFKQVDGPFKVS